MFERFTEKAIKVIMLAQEEARRLDHNFVGTEQILLGLIGEGTGVAAKVLKSMGVNLKDARIEVEKIIGRGSGFVAVDIPFTPRAKRVLELSLQEARQLGHKYIGTEHLLLGLIREGEGVAARVLENLSVDLSQVRTLVIQMLGETVAEVAEEEEFEPVVQSQNESDLLIEIMGSPSNSNPAPRPTKILEGFLCNVPEDEELREQLEKHLKTLEREGMIKSWHEGLVMPGQEEESEIAYHLDKANVILLLVSSDFIASDEVYENKIKEAREKYESGQACVIVVILRACDWKNESLFDNLPVLPKDAKPVKSWTNPDEAFESIAQGIRKEVEQLRQRDERGVNDTYEHLKKELAAKDWQKADEATKTLMLKVSRREEAGCLTPEDIENFPLQDIRAIDKLWVKNSDGRFGLSVQKRILQKKNYEDLIKDVGWRMDDSWSEYENLNFTLAAPKGHFPYCGVHFWKAVPRINPYRWKPPIYQPPYRYPVNYQQQQRQLDRILKPRPFYPQPTNYNRRGGGGELIVLGVIAAVAGMAWAVDKVDEKFFREERQRQKQENEIREKIEALLSRLD